MDDPSKDKNSNGARALFESFRTAKIVQTATIEAPAFFGLVVCFLAVTSQVMHSHPFYWVNTLSYFILIVRLAMDFPTKEKLVKTMKKKFQHMLEY